MLRDSVVVVVAVMRTRPRAILLAISVSQMSMGLRLAAQRAAGGPLKTWKGYEILCLVKAQKCFCEHFPPQYPCGIHPIIVITTVTTFQT